MNVINLFFNKQSKESESVNNSVKSENTEKKPETKSEVKADKVIVHNLIILDESGSMVSIYEPALTGVNETLQTIRESQKQHPEQEHYVSLVAFDTSHYNKIYHNTPAPRATDITSNQYRPCGGTPLYDAMGRAINELRNIVKGDDVVLVTIITDGYENASKEYNGKAIKALVEEMKKLGWVFTYIGANQDVEAVAASMSINNHLEFQATHTGTKEMFAKEKRCREAFFNKVHASRVACKINKNFASEDDYFKED